tara:strand:+ start:3857 stop:5677 length:1821 start_codon:yes stop_codon:yes gene_type:complete
MTNKELFARLQLRLIERFSLLPNKGVIAGQAVAEVYYREMNLPYESRMKDLDHFTEVHHFIDNVKTAFKRTEVDDVAIFSSSFSSEPHVDFVTKGSYSIIHCSTTNDINTIAVRYDVKDQFNAINILNGFDLNCAAIALDMETQEVIIHPSFFEFCTTGELKLISTHTPASSLIRLINKSTQIKGVNKNLNYQIELLKLALNLRLSDDKVFHQGTGVTVGRWESLETKTQDTIKDLFSINESSFTTNAPTPEHQELVDVMMFVPKIDNNKLIGQASEQIKRMASYQLNVLEKITLMQTENPERIFNVSVIENMDKDITSALMLRALFSEDIRKVFEFSGSERSDLTCLYKNMSGYMMFAFNQAPEKLMPFAKVIGNIYRENDLGALYTLFSTHGAYGSGSDFFETNEVTQALQFNDYFTSTCNGKKDTIDAQLKKEALKGYVTKLTDTIPMVNSDKKLLIRPIFDTTELRYTLSFDTHLIDIIDVNPYGFGVKGKTVNRTIFKAEVGYTSFIVTVDYCNETYRPLNVSILDNQHSMMSDDFKLEIRDIIVTETNKVFYRTLAGIKYKVNKLKQIIVNKVVTTVKSTFKTKGKKQGSSAFFSDEIPF